MEAGSARQSNRGSFMKAWTKRGWLYYCRVGNACSGWAENTTHASCRRGRSHALPCWSGRSYTLSMFSFYFNLWVICIFLSSPWASFFSSCLFTGASIVFTIWPEQHAGKKTRHFENVWVPLSTHTFQLSFIQMLFVFDGSCFYWSNKKTHIFLCVCVKLQDLPLTLIWLHLRGSFFCVQSVLMQ